MKGLYNPATVRSKEQVYTADDSVVCSRESMLYLGSTLAADGSISVELGRRLGLARADFNALQLVWGHAALKTDQKLRIYQACVVSKLLYGLHTAFLRKVERGRLDAFHARSCEKMSA